ncbi:MAG: 2'-deoxycytidine 5'-triphosphate deaminase [Acidimicrobiales bacterium]
MTPAPTEPTIDLPAGAAGVLARRHLLEAIATGVIAADDPVPEANVQPASLDLRLGEVAYRMRCSFLPGADTVERKLKDHVIDEIDLREEGGVLETNRPYLVPLKERLALPPEIRAKANPKSSTGRVDVFTRVITDHGFRFDEVATGYRGPLWLEIVPLSFAIGVREGLSLNQLRLSVGRTQLSDEEIAEFHAQTHHLLLKDGVPVPPDRLALADGLFLSLDLRGDADGRVGHQAKPNAPRLNLHAGAPVDPAPYFEPVRREGGNRIVLAPQRFYLLMSDEAVSIPPELASEMTAYDPTSGELRTHYAGFFDPGFGFDAGPNDGSRAALEVRAHDVPFMIEHGQRVCKLTFDRMLEPPDVLYGSGIGSSYQHQEETLGKHFRRPSRRRPPAPRDDPQQSFPIDASAP